MVRFSPTLVPCRPITHKRTAPESPALLDSCSSQRQLPVDFVNGTEVALMALGLVEEAQSLDVRRLAREGLLRPGVSVVWTWRFSGGASASVRLTALPSADNRTQAGAVEIGWSLDGTDLRQKVPLTWTPLHFGGVRPWWKCSCGRRAAWIHYRWRGWRCRTCATLSYASQNERADYRAWRRRDKIRARLGAEPGCHTIWPWQKPKGMHWSTFERLVAKAECADRLALRLAVKRFGLEGELQKELAELDRENGVP